MSKSQVALELRLIRRRMGLTQAAMAVRLAVSQSAYEKYERGERNVPLALLASAREVERVVELEKAALRISVQAESDLELVPKADHFERWIQGCWTVFLASSVWLVLRIMALELNTDFLRLGPNDEALGVVFLLFALLATLLAHETWRRWCEGLPIRKQRRVAFGG